MLGGKAFLENLDVDPHVPALLVYNKNITGIYHAPKTNITIFLIKTVQKGAQKNPVFFSAKKGKTIDFARKSPTKFRPPMAAENAILSSRSFGESQLLAAYSVPGEKLEILVIVARIVRIVYEPPWGPSKRGHSFGVAPFGG